MWTIDEYDPTFRIQKEPMEHVPVVENQMLI